MFDHLCKKGGFLPLKRLREILDLIEFHYTEHDFELIQRYADEGNSGTIHAYEFMNQILFSKEVAPCFDICRWLNASKELNGRYRLLELVREQIESIREHLITRFGDNDGKHSGIITVNDFADLLGGEVHSLSESDKHVLSSFATKGSRRTLGDQVETDLLNFFHFSQALDLVIEHMRKEAIASISKMTDDQEDTSLGKFRKHMELEMQRQQRIDS